MEKYKYCLYDDGSEVILERVIKDGLYTGAINEMYTDFEEIEELLNEKEKYIGLLIQKIEKYEELINTVYHMTAPYRK